MPTNYFYILIFAILFSCSPKEEPTVVKEVVIDVTNPKEILFFDLVDTCYFISLDAKAIIGEIETMQITDDIIGIMDPSASKSAFIFDWNGNLLTQIQAQGEGPGQYRIPRYLSILEKEEKVLIYDDAGPKLLFFSMDGTYEKEIPLGKYGQFNDIMWNETGFWAYSRLGRFSTGDAIQFFEADLSAVKLPISPISLQGWEEDHGGQNFFFESSDGNSYYFQSNTTRDLIEFNDQGVLDHIRFSFSNRGLDYTNPNINPYDLLHLSRSQNLIYLSPDLVDLGKDYLLLGLVDSGVGSLAIYDKKNQKGIQISRLVNDLSLMMNFSSIPGPYVNQPGYLSLAMPFSQFESIRNQVDFSQNRYKDVVHSISSEDPESLVLMIYKIKDELNLDAKLW